MGFLLHKMTPTFADNKAKNANFMFFNGLKI